MDDNKYRASFTEALADTLKRRLSLDPQSDSLSEMGGEAALGFIPGVGQAMALRDYERARREGSTLGMTAALASLLPWGRIAKGGKEAVRRIHAPTRDVSKASETLEALRKSTAPDPNAARQVAYEQTHGLILPQGGKDIVHDVWRLGQPNREALERSIKGPVPLTDVVDLSHVRSDVRKQLGELQVALDPQVREMGARGTMNPNDLVARIDPALLRDPAQLRGTFGHEVQHGLDLVSGAPAFGTSPGEQLDYQRWLAKILNERKGKDIAGMLEAQTKIPARTWERTLMRFRGEEHPYDLYRRNLGEVGARVAGDIEAYGPNASALSKLTQEGIDLTPRQWKHRLITPGAPLEHEDIMDLGVRIKNLP